MLQSCNRYGYYTVCVPSCHCEASMVSITQRGTVDSSTAIDMLVTMMEPEIVDTDTLSCKQLYLMK